ncbi:hypothetical protein SXHG_00128 [Synechococcus phage MRHenn-2013a]|nr:hypothetical protein SXHG_00128 [Synechococcus phage MRHenn-2013a]
MVMINTNTGEVETKAPCKECGATGFHKMDCGRGQREAYERYLWNKMDPCTRHYCPEWDQLLIDRLCPEWGEEEACRCGWKGRVDFVE